MTEKLQCVLCDLEMQPGEECDCSLPCLHCNECHEESSRLVRDTVSLLHKSIVFHGRIDLKWMAQR